MSCGIRRSALVRPPRTGGTACVMLAAMNSVQISDETFVCARSCRCRARSERPGELAAVVARSAPDRRRGPPGPAGVRWTVAGADRNHGVWLGPPVDRVILLFPACRADRGQRARPGAAGPGQAEPHPPGGGQADGIRGQRPVSGSTGRSGFRGCLLARGAFGGAGTFQAWRKTARTIYIDARSSTVMDVIADIGSYPEWVAEYKEAEVLDADAAEQPKTARLVLDAAVLRTPWCYPTSSPADRKSVTWTRNCQFAAARLGGAYRLSPKGFWNGHHLRAAVRRPAHPDDRLLSGAERRLTDLPRSDLRSPSRGGCELNMASKCPPPASACSSVRAGVGKSTLATAPPGAYGARLTSGC